MYRKLYCRSRKILFSSLKPASFYMTPYIYIVIIYSDIISFVLSQLCFCKETVKQISMFSNIKFENSVYFQYTYVLYARVCVYLCICVCVCARARARVRVCVSQLHVVCSYCGITKSYMLISIVKT
jgi:hypothetical protein